MQLKSTSATGNFELETNTGEKLLEFTYSNWFSSDARTSFQSTEIEIKPKNIWSSKFDIVKNGLPFISMNSSDIYFVIFFNKNNCSI